MPLKSQPVKCGAIGRDDVETVEFAGKNFHPFPDCIWRQLLPNSDLGSFFRGNKKTGGPFQTARR